MPSLKDPQFPFPASFGPEDDRLHGFFVPALARSSRYDRATGYFSSRALVSVARGLVGFLHNGGRMRLLAGAQLSDADVAALDGGRVLEDVLVKQLLGDPVEGATLVAKRRFEVLAWMVREGRLEVKIAVRTDDQGRPLTGSALAPYYHKKSAVFYDGEWNRIALVGSNNESAMGWEEEGNAEEFHVFRSWRPEPWKDHGEAIVDAFEKEWNGGLQRWRVMPLPDAVRDHLIQRVTFEGDPPYETEADLKREVPRRTAPIAPADGGLAPVADPEALERLERLREAPRRDGGSGVGIVTAPVEPWPHQQRIAHQVTRTYPRSYLFADEVGMGKTIEAGLVFRELLLSGKAQRILILVPANVIKQWQEELWEKFLLRIPRLEKNGYWYREDGIDEAAIPPLPGGNPWNAFPVLIATSHLARTRKRRDQVIAAGPWDVVFVDEAHHARRRGSKSDATPNELLTLLRAMKEKASWQALYLASATPMQMYAHEAWDLLELLGLTERWGRSAEEFTTYFAQLRQSGVDRDWHFLQTMLADHLSEPDNSAPQAVQQRIRELVPSPLRVKRITHLHERPMSNSTLAQLLGDERSALDYWLRENTPMRRRVFRTTRSTLHEYMRVGLLDSSTVIPERLVADRFISMDPAEADLYNRIEEYIGRYYNHYKARGGAQRALGFIMTVYRRRLTSSFEAITRSLRKRRTVLHGDGATLDKLLDEDDVGVVANEDRGLFDLEQLEDSRQRLGVELDELDAFVADLERLPPDESKMHTLLDDLQSAFSRGHSTAIVFTQYGDTMDYVANKLTATFGPAVATWSGSGGRRWNAATKVWNPIPKPELKNLFRAGNEIRVLVGTDSMSEGLNLQTCGLLVNYDMPWNFMRVEQRIGRIDRIGGLPKVEVFNYFYRDTVEQRIYEGLAEDIDWFESVVGPARPVLGQIESIIEDAAMRGNDSTREAGIKEAIDQVRMSLETAREQPVQLDDLAQGVVGDDPDPVVNLKDIETEIWNNPLTRPLLIESMEYPGAFRLASPGAERLVTFDRDLVDFATQPIEFLTFGGPAFEELLDFAMR